MANEQFNGFISISELLQSLREQNSGFLNGDYFQFDGNNGSGSMLAGRTTKEIIEFNKLSAKAQEKGLTVEKLFTELEAVARGRGLQLVAAPSGRNDNTYNIIYVPVNDTRYNAREIAEGSTEAARAFAQSLPQFSFSGIDANGLISVNGQKTINQGMIDIEGEEVVYYTMMEKLLREQLHKFNTGRRGQNTSFLRNLDRMNNSSLSEAVRNKATRAARGSVKYTTKNVMNGSVASSNFQSLIDEYSKAMQGIGSNRSRDIRKGYVNVKPMIDALLEADWDVIRSYQKQYSGRGNTSIEGSKEQIAKDLMTVLTLYAQSTDVSNIEDELNVFGAGKYKYLKGSETIKRLRGVGKIINTIRPDIGTSQEGSISNFLMSFVRNKDVGLLGSLDDRSNRKRLQVANTLQRMTKARQSLESGMPGIRVKKLYTAHENTNRLFGDDTDYEYGVGFATEEQIREAGQEVYQEILQELQDKYKNKKSAGEIERIAKSKAGLLGGAHSGGIYYSSAIKSTLDSEQLRTMSVDQDKFQKEVEKILESAKKKGQDMSNEAAMHQAALNFVRDHFGIRQDQLADNQSGKSIDISDILTYGGGEHRILSIVQKKEMKDGVKLMGGSDFSMKGTGTELDPRVIRKIYEKRGLDGSDVSFLRNPEALDIRSLSGLLEGYMRQVFSVMSDQQIGEALRSSSLLSGAFRLDTDTKKWVLGKDIFDDANEDTLLQFINELNGLKHNIFQNVFSVKDKSISVDFNKLMLSTDVAQFAGYDYGEPGDKNLNVDYRFKGAVDRGLMAASMGTQTDLSILSRYLLGRNKQSHIGSIGWSPEVIEKENGTSEFASAGLYNGNAEDQKRYIDWLKQYQHIKSVNDWSLDRTKSYGIKDIIKNNDLVLGYGDLDTFLGNYGIEDFNEYVKQQNPELTGEALRTKVDELYDILSSRYIDLSDEIDGISTALKYEDGHITAESWSESFGKIQKLQQTLGPNGHTIFAPSSGAFYTQSGDKAAAGNFVALPDLNMFDTEAASVDDDGNKQYDLPAVFKSLFSLISSERYLNEQRNLQNEHDPSFNTETLEWAERGLSETIVQTIATFISEVESKNGSLWQRANKVAIGHSMFGSAIAGPTYNRAQKVSIDDEIQRRIDDVGVTISVEDAEALLGMQEDDKASTYLQALRANYHYLYDETKSYKEVEQDLENLLKDAPKDKDKVKILLQKLIESNTIGSDEFQNRLAATRANGGTFRGLSGQFLRFPLSNGLDVQNSELFFDSAMNKGSMRAGLGIGRGVNLDFDGDKIVFHLDLTGGDLIDQMDSETIQKLLSEKKTAVDFQNRINSAIALTTAQGMLSDITDKDGNPKGLYTVKDKSGKITGIKSDLSQVDIQKIFDDQAQSTAAILSRLNKGYTGLLSNNYQAITEVLASIQGHSDNVALDNNISKENFIRDMITRGVFEGFTQDAISSKKVVKRIAEREVGGEHTDNWAPNTEFFEELNQLMSIFKDQKTYSSEDGVRQAFDRAIKMGIFKQDDMFSDRITARILATAQQLFTNENGDVDNAGFAKALGIDEDIAKKIRFEYDSNGNAVSTGYKPGEIGLNLDAVVRAVMETDTAMRIHTGQGIGSAQQRKAFNIPGGLDASTNPTYRLGGELYTQDELDKIKQIDPALGRLISQYGILKETAEETTKALDAEASAEQNKIGIAGAETKAITAGTKAYSERMGVLKKLGTISEDAYSASVSTALNGIFGNPYGDTKPFADALVKRYDELNAKGTFNLSEGVSPDLLGYTDEVGADRYRGFQKGYWAPVEGKIADALEQVLTEVNQGLFKQGSNLAGTITSYDELKQFLQNAASNDLYKDLREQIQAALISGTKGAEGVDFLLGSAQYTGEAEQYLRPDKNGIYSVNGQDYTDLQEAFAALKEANSINSKMFLASYGDRAELFKNHYLTQGKAQFSATLAAADGDIGRIGSGEQELLYSPDGRTTIHGRADRIIYGKRRAGDEDLFGDQAFHDQDTITVFDKKIGDKLNPRYIAQVMQYILMLQQAQDVILQSQDTASPIKTAEDFASSDLGKLYHAQYGYNPIGDELFKKLANNAAINGGLLMTDSKGHNTRYDIGFNGRSGAFNLTGNKDIDAVIMSYLKNGVSYDSWDDVYKNAYIQSAKINPAGEGVFESSLVKETKALELYKSLWEEFFDLLKEVHDLEQQLKVAEAAGDAAKIKDLQELIALRNHELKLKKAEVKNATQNIDSENPEFKKLDKEHKRRIKVLNKTGINDDAQTVYETALEVYNKYKKVYDGLYKTLFTDLDVQIEQAKLAGEGTTDLEKKRKENEESDVWRTAQADLTARAEKVNQYASKLDSMVPQMVDSVDEHGNPIKIFKPREQVDITKVKAESEEKSAAAVTATRESAFSDARSTYVKLRRERTGLLKELNFYEAALEDDTLTDDVREAYTEAAQTIKETLLKDVDEQLKKIIKMFSLKNKSDGTYTSVDDKFTDLYTQTEAAQDIKEKRNEEQSQEKYNRSRHIENERNSREAYSVYTTLNDRNLALLKNEQAMSKTNDETSLAFLAEERKALEELYQLAQDAVTELEKAHKGNGANGADSANDTYWQGILAKAKKRADLEYQVKSNDLMARNKTGGPQFSGIFPAVGKQLGGYFSRFFTGMGIYRILGKLRQGIGALVKEADTLDATLTNLQITTGGTRADTRQLIADYAQVGRQLGATTQEVANSALEWQRQGYDAAEVTDLVTSSLYLSKLGMIDSASATKDLTSALKGFKMQASESMDVVDKLTAIDLKAATSAGEIAEGLAQFANVGSLSGVNIDEAAAYVATISDVTQMTGSSAGQALKTIISRYGNVKAGAYNQLTFESDTESAEALNDVERVLKKLGISIRDSNLSFKSFDTVLDEIAKKWSSLDNVSQKAIANAFAGVRQQEAFTTLMQNWDKYESLLETSRNSKGTAETKYDAYQESLQAAKNAYKTTWEELANNAQISEFLKSVYDIGTYLGKITPYVIKYLPQLIIALEQIKTLSGKESFIQKGIGFLGKNGIFDKGGFKKLLFGGTTGASSTEWAPGTGVNLFNPKVSSEAMRTVINDIKERKAERKGRKEEKRLAKQRQIMDKQEARQVDAQVLAEQTRTPYADVGSAHGGAYARDRSRPQTPDPYAQAYNALGVNVNASSKDIQKAYYALAKKYHPNNANGSGDIEKFQQITEAYKQLKRRDSIVDNGAAATQVTQPVQPTQPSTPINNIPMLNNAAQNKLPATISSNQSESALPTVVATNLPAGYKYDKNGRLHGPNGKFAKLPGTTAPQAQQQPTGGNTSTGSTMGKAQVGAAMASYAAGQLASAITSYQTAGLTHTYKNANGETQTVNSSEEAHSASRAISTGFSAAIPIIGPVLGNAIGDAVAKNIDAERDRTNEATEKAQKRLVTIRGINSDIKTMASLSKSSKAEDVEAREEASDNILSEMYKSENTETRQMLQGYLSEIYGEQVTLRDVMKDYTSKDIKSRERAAKALQIAQKKAENKEKQEARGNELYNYQKSVDKQMLEYNASRDGYEENGITTAERWGNIGGAAGVGVGTGAAVGAGAAVTGLLTAAAMSTTVPVWGWIVGGVLAAAAGVTAAIASFQAQEDADEEANARKWDEMSLDEKIEYLEEQVDGTKEVVDENGEITQAEQKGLEERISDLDNELATNVDLTASEREDIASQLNVLEEQLAVTTETLNTLNDYRDYLQSLVDEDNEMVIEEALLQAGVKSDGQYADSKTKIKDVDKYLMDMNISQLKDYGTQGIYEILANAINPDDLTDMEAYTTDASGNKVLSQQFIEMAESILKSDEEISAVLSGESYTLNEAYTNLKGKNDQFSKEILQNFAEALGTTVDELDEYIGTLGTLTLSDLLKTTRELIDSVSEYSSLLSSVVDSTQSASDWMSTIVSKFPDLISYMGDTPTLIGKLIEKISQLNNQLLNAQYAEYSSSAEYFDTTIKKDILSTVEKNNGSAMAETVKGLIKDNHITTMDDLTKYLVGIDETSDDYGAAQVLKAAYKTAGSGTILRANAYTEELQQFTEYISGLMQKEVSALEEQKNALSEINNQREYELKLMEAKLNLENAINNKQRVYRAGVGFVYEADQGAIADAQKELDQVESEKEVSKISKQIEIMQGAVDKWSSIWDIQTEEAKEIQADNFAKTVLGWENGITDVKNSLTGVSDTTANGLSSVYGEMSSANGTFTNMNSTLSSTISTGYSNVVDATHGVSTSIAEQTIEILSAKDAQAADAKVKLAELWEKYDKIASDSNSTAAQKNSALAEYRSAFSDAVSNGYINTNSYAGWTQGGETQSDGTVTEGSGFGSTESYEAGTSTNTFHNRHEWVLGTTGEANIGYGLWKLSGSTLTELSGTSDDAVNILEDMKKNDADDAWYWTKDNWNVGDGGSSFVNSEYAPLDSDKTLTDYAARIYGEKGVKDMIIVGSHGDNEWAWLHNGRVYALSATSADGKAKDIAKKGVWDQQNAKGTLDSGYGISLINELGTEAIVTPQGTITALPSHSGVVPADITKNLWSLGEIAPNILRVMEHHSQDIIPGSNLAGMTDESFNISNLVMNVSADGSFDADAFVESIKNRVALTKNIRR